MIRDKSTNVNNYWFEDTDGDVEIKTNQLFPYMYLVILCTWCTTPRKEHSGIQNPRNAYFWAMLAMWRGISCGMPLFARMLLVDMYVLEKMNYKSSRTQKALKTKFQCWPNIFTI